MNNYDAEVVRAAARDRWADVLSRLGMDMSHLSGHHTKCPGCGGRDRFRFDDRSGTGSFLCSQGTGEILSGDGIGLVAHWKGLKWPEAIALIGDAICPDKARRWEGSGAGGSAAGERKPAMAAAPVAEVPAGAMKFDLGTLRRAVREDLRVDEGWLWDRSPVDVGSIGSPEDYLGSVYGREERVLIFTNYYSQGDVLYEPGRGVYRLAEKPGVKAARMEAIPRRVGNDGIWYLSQPVSGRWEPNPRGKPDGNGNLPFGRRIYECFTDWRHVVIESDEAPDGLWLNFLVQLPLPIVAIYRSGGRSIHALCRIENHSLPGFQEFRRRMLPMLSKYGADPGALTANRLTRLPLGERKVATCPACRKVQTAMDRRWMCKCGVWLAPELGQWVSQRLLYLNPNPEPGGLPICEGGCRLWSVG